MDVFKGRWEERRSLTWDQFLSCTAHFHTHVTDSLEFVNITLHTYHNGDRLVFLSFHPLTVTSYSSHCWMCRSVVFSCLLSHSLHFSRSCTSLSHDRCLTQSFQAFLLLSWCHSLKKRRAKILQCHFCVTRHLSGRKRSDNVCMKSWIPRWAI